MNRTKEMLSLQDCNCTHGRKDLRLESGLLVACIKDGSAPLIKHLVKCWNMHDALVETLEETYELLLDMWPHISRFDTEINETCNKSQALLAKAKGNP